MTFLSKSQQARSKAWSLHKTLYLTSNDHTSQKVQNVRHDIEQLLQDYYNRVPLSDVNWCCDFVRQCLFDTVVIPEFSPYRVRHAFRLIERMIMNLMCWPWRQEFHRICLYGGMFKTQIIGAQLIGYKNIFTSIGYELVGGAEFCLAPHKLPVDVSLLAALSFDCIMAQVVCNDIIQVYLRLNTQNASDSRNFVTTSSDRFDDSPNPFSWTKIYLRDRYDKLRDKSIQVVSDHLQKLQLSKSCENTQSPSYSSIVNRNSQSAIEQITNSATSTNAESMRRMPRSTSDQYYNHHQRRVHEVSGSDKNNQIKYSGHLNNSRSAAIQHEHVFNPDDYEHEDDDVRDLLHNCRLEELHRQNQASEQGSKRLNVNNNQNNVKVRGSSLLRSLGASNSIRSTANVEPKSKSKFYVTERSYEPETGQILHKFVRPSITTSPLPTNTMSTAGPSSISTSNWNHKSPANQTQSQNDNKNRLNQYPQQSYL